MIYLLTAFGLTPGGSSTIHIYTQTIHRTTHLTKKNAVNIYILYRELLFVRHVAVDQQRSINPVWTKVYLRLPTSVYIPNTKLSDCIEYLKICSETKRTGGWTQLVCVSVCSLRAKIVRERRHTSM